jgi:hypothetical protein
MARVRGPSSTYLWNVWKKRRRKAGVCLATLGPGATKVYTYYDLALEVVGDTAARLTDFNRSV